MVPKQGDVLWISVEPHCGKEIGGHDSNNPYRSILVVSSNNYNRTGLVMGMPITSHNRVPGAFAKMLIPIVTQKTQIHVYVIPFELPCFDWRAQSASGRVKVIDRDYNLQNWQKIRFYLKNIFRFNLGKIIKGND